MDPGLPGQNDWPAMLAMLKSEDPMDVYQGAMSLQTALQFAQENNMSGFQTEQYMEILVKLVVREPITDLCNEVKFFSISCLVSLMDIFPSLINSLINHGLVKGMTGVLQSCMGFVEIGEACIKAFEKIVIENPGTVLKSGAVAIIIEQLDFFVVPIQQKVFRILQRIARHSATEADFDQYMLPIVPFITMSLTQDGSGTDQKKLEDTSKIVVELQESFCMFYSPINDFQKVSAQYDKLVDAGVFDIILNHIHQVAEINNRVQLEKSKQDVDENAGSSLINDQNDMMIDSVIDSGNTNQVLSNQTILNFFRVLENGNRYSHNVSNKLFGQSALFKDLSSFLPHDFSGKKKQYNAEDFPFIMEVINLLNSTFSDQGVSFSSLHPSGFPPMLHPYPGHPREPRDDSKENPHQKRIQIRKEFENKKKQYQTDPANKEKIVDVAQSVLPRVFFVYESTINPSFRIKTLQVIDKIISLFDDELLRNFIEPTQFANFISQIIKQRHSQSIDAALKITRKILDSSPLNYSVPFIREGVSKLIKDISTEEKFKKFMGIARDVNIADKSFDMDVHEVKEALHFQRLYNPEDHAMRDFYERKLLTLVEKQKQEAAEANKEQSKQEEEKKAGDEEKKQENQEEKKEEKKQDKKEEKIEQPNPIQNTALMIVGQSQAIMCDYFENTAFIEKLQQSSPELQRQLNILSDLTEISSGLCSEATQLQSSLEEMANIQSLLQRVSDYLTSNQNDVTSNEFKNSNLLFAFELLLTKTPSQAKLAVDQKRYGEKEEMKHSEEIDLMEKQKLSKQVSKKDSRCLIYRLKLFAHIFLNKKGGGISPFRVLVELNHKIISENDSFLLQSRNQQQGPQHHVGPPPGFPGGPPGYGMSTLFSQAPGLSADYDHCINALRQLQRPVTVNLVYDSKKSFLKKGQESSNEDKIREKQLKDDLQAFKDMIQQNTKQLDELSDKADDAEDKLEKKDQEAKEEKETKEADKDKQEDNEMEDQTENADKDIPLIDEQQLEKELLENMPKKGLEMKKAQTTHPALMNLGASPKKDGGQAGSSSLERGGVGKSKVFMKRHYLYTELKQIPVHVEQSSCIQVLEDFLRNRVKNIGQVKGLKYDHTFGGFGRGPPGDYSSPFGQYFGGRYQSITQKIMKKNLGNAARKILDQANQKLASILNDDIPIRVRQQRKKKKEKIPNDDEEMHQEDEGSEKRRSRSGSRSKSGEEEPEESHEPNENDNDSYNSKSYGDEEPEDEEELIEADIARQKLLEAYVDDLSDELVNSEIPEDQQLMLVKILNKQHTFMLEQLRLNLEDAAGRDDGSGEYEQMRGAMYCFEERVEEFQETMDRVQSEFHKKKAQLREIAKIEEAAKKEEEKKTSKEEEKKASQEEGKKSGEKEQDLQAKLIEQILSNEADQQMNDQTEDNDKKQDENKESAMTSEKIPLENENLEENRDKPQEAQEVPSNPIANPDNDVIAPKDKIDTDAQMIKEAENEEMMTMDNISQPKLVSVFKGNEGAGAGAQKYEVGDELILEEEQLASILNAQKQFRVDQEGLELMLEKELQEQDRKIQRALEKEKMMRHKMKEMKGVQQRVVVDQVSEQTQENIAEDLEELIKQQGEDIDFEFYYQGKRIQLNQTVFEIIKDQEQKRTRYSDRPSHHTEQIKIIQEKEKIIHIKLMELQKKSEKLQSSSNEDEKKFLHREGERLREMLYQLQRQLGPPGYRGGPPGSYPPGMGGPSHSIYFCINDKVDEVSDLKRQRLDSLTELTSAALRRTRTKSEAVMDISSASINEFVEQLLKEEFKVFDAKEVEAEDNDTDQKKGKTLDLIEEEDEMQIDSAAKKEDKVDRRAASQKQEKDQIEQSLKILKVINYLFTHQDIISNKGIRFIMKAQYTPEAQQSSLASPSKKDNQSQGIDSSPEAKDQSQPGFEDIDLKSGFAELSAKDFYHLKLDSYLQKSIKDPYNLVQGAISNNLQQIFKNCPFLFPFSTKELYFKLVSFIGAIDAHRSIYFLRQYIKQQGGTIKTGHRGRDDFGKIAKQKVVIHRTKLIESAFQLIQKIEKTRFMEFEFHGEQGVGLGPTLEFYDNIAEDFKKWNIKINDDVEYSMWRLTGDNFLFPSPVCIKSFSQEKIKQIYEIFRVCGTIVAKAIVDDRMIDLPISPLFWRLCMGYQMSIFDYQKLDDTIFNTLAEFQVISNKAEEIDKQCRDKNLSSDERERQLESLTISNGSRVQDYCFVFTLPCYDHIELVQSGMERDVVLENAQDYVDLVMHYTFHETVKMQIAAFKKGFNAIFPIASMAPFTHCSSSEEELETMVCGIKCNDSEWQNKEELMKYIVPDHGYTRQSQSYNHFIRYIAEMTPPKRQEFVKFLTGSKRLPIGGFKNLQPNLTLVLKRDLPGQGQDVLLPSVMTCQNYVKCPTYSSYEVFKAKFDLAVTEGQQIFAFD